MKWTKFGKIFDPTAHKLADNCINYAQGPQALPLEDRVRVYFSTRERDSTDKFLSHVSYVEFDPTFTTVLRVANHTVIPLGETGAFDEHGIFPIHLFENGNELWGFTTGWSRRVSVSVDTSIGLAISRDGGETFTKMGNGGPIMSASLHEPFLIADPFVSKVGSDYHMWYIFGTRWQAPISADGQAERVYKIGHAMSRDGIAWERDGRAIITSKLHQDECQALPSVLRHNGRYHMVFCYREVIGFRTSTDAAYRLGYAYSDDMVEWIRDDEALGLDVSLNGWDSEMMCYPHLFGYDGSVYLLYNGNQFGRDGFGLAVLESW
jgi:sucrose-6-phosphate hydrolase SacC (GH32 family)